MSEKTEPKKRTRRKKTEILQQATLNNVETSNENIQLQMTEVPAATEVKKRGRKPKGGKLLPKNTKEFEEKPTLQNIILHLKCSTKDLTDTQNVINHMNYNNEIPPDIMTYSPNNNGNLFTLYNSDDEKKFAYTNNNATLGANKENFICSNCSATENNVHNEDNVENKTINQKLKKIKLDLYKNNLSDKQSACFWCTYEFDNPPCYIPKYEMDGEMYAYGSFCRPECAVAYLMKENIDDSAKFERYQILNRIYGKVYDFKNNIKPAPNPYYLLDKFYGNMTIQEYRKLLKSEHMLSVIDKPMTRMLPELHENNDDFQNSIYGTSDQGGSTGGGYKVKRKSEKQAGPSKSEIMRENFGFVI